MMLLTCTPVPGTTTPEPLAVRAGHARRAPVGVHDRDVGRRAQARREEPVDVGGIGEAGGELVGALVLGGLHRGDDVGQRRRARGGVEALQREREQHAARVRRRVGEHVAAAVARADRLAGHRRVGGQVRRRQHAAALADPGGDLGRDRAGVERRRALGTEQLDGLRQVVGAERLALDEQRAAGANSARASGVVSRMAPRMSYR
jgi:hypothetical protein